MERIGLDVSPQGNGYLASDNNQNINLIHENQRLRDENEFLKLNPSGENNHELLHMKDLLINKERHIFSLE